MRYPILSITAYDWASRTHFLSNRRYSEYIPRTHFRRVPISASCFLTVSSKAFCCRTWVKVERPIPDWQLCKLKSARIVWPFACFTSSSYFSRQFFSENKINKRVYKCILLNNKYFNRPCSLRDNVVFRIDGASGTLPSKCIGIWFVLTSFTWDSTPVLTFSSGDFCSVALGTPANTFSALNWGKLAIWLAVRDVRLSSIQCWAP